MKAPELRHGAASDVGPVRPRNEDAWLTRPPVFVVADGMGGHRGGEVASGIVIEEFARLEVSGLDTPRATDLLISTLTRCQARIQAWGETQGDPAARHAGTTVAAALAVTGADGPHWLLANLGDSRLHRLTQGVLEQVSVDHSVVQQLLDAGVITADEALVHPERHVITRALGGTHGVRPDFFVVPLAAGDRLVLCTDGVSGPLPAHQMQHLLAAHSDPQAAAEALVAAALAAGGRDNATVVVVDVMGLTSHDTWNTTARTRRTSGAEHETKCGGWS